MRITFRTNGYEITAENEHEKSYLRTMLERLNWTFHPTFITYEQGIRIIGKSEEQPQTEDCVKCGTPYGI